jgi:hypothetical protein
MKNRFKAMSGALALTFMLLFSAVAFAHTTNTSTGNPNMSAPGMPSADNQRWKHRRHRRHRRHLRRMAHSENRQLRRELKNR